MVDADLTYDFARSRNFVQQLDAERSSSSGTA